MSPFDEPVAWGDPDDDEKPEPPRRLVTRRHRRAGRRPAFRCR